MITLDMTRILFTSKLVLDLVTDKEFVETSSLKVTPYDSGATRWDLRGRISTLTLDQRDYVTGIFIPHYLENETFEITLPSEANYTTTSTVRTYEVTTEVGGGSNTVTLNRVGDASIISGDIAVGRYFNNSDSDRLYMVNSIDTNTGIMKFAPHSDKTFSVDSVFNFYTPTLKMICVNKNLSRTFTQAADNLSDLVLSFVEDL